MRQVVKGNELLPSLKMGLAIIGGLAFVTLTALSILRKSFCLFELIMMIQAFKINKSVLSFLVFCVLKFDCFSLLPFVLSLLLLTIEGLFRAKIHNSA